MFRCIVLYFCVKLLIAPANALAGVVGLTMLVGEFVLFIVVVMIGMGEIVRSEGGAVCGCCFVVYLVVEVVVVVISALVFWLLRNMAKTLLLETAFVTTVTLVAPGVLIVRGNGD